MARTPSRARTDAPAAPRHSIPAVPTGGDLAADFDALGAAAPAPAPKKKSGDKPTMPMTAEAKAALVRWATAAVLFDAVEARKKNSEGPVKEFCFDYWCEQLWRNKTQPANPALKAETPDGRPDIEAIFQVQDKFSKNNMAIPQVPEGTSPVEAIVALLVELGLEEAEARRFLAEEVDLKPVHTLRAFNELIFGHYEGKEWQEATDEEKAVGKKLMDFVKTLSPDERALVLRSEHQITVKKGVIPRVPGYCRRAADVKSIFRVFTPTHFASHAKMGISDTPTRRAERLGEIARDIIGDQQ